MEDDDKPKAWVCPIHGEVSSDDLKLHPSGQWGTHGYCSAVVIQTSEPEFYTRVEDDVKPLYAPPFKTEALDYGPSWGCIISMGMLGIVLCVLILLFA